MATESTPSLGRRLNEATPTAGLTCEADAGKAERFRSMDDVLGRLLTTALRGRLVVNASRTEGVWTVGLKLPQADLDAIADWYTVPEQERRGAWYLPRDVSLKVGLINLPGYFHVQPRFATGRCLDDRARVALADSPAGMYLWSVVQPLFERLARPIILRGPEAGALSPDEHIAEWAALDEFFGALGLELGGELSRMRYGCGWSRLTSAEQLAVKQAYLATLTASVDREVGRRWRMYSIKTLIAKYYAKAAKRIPTQKQVLTGPLQRIIAGWFQGDWLAFVDYLDQQPSPDERITTALPTPHLYVETGQHAAVAAAATGLPKEEVQRIIASFLGQSTTESPVEKRLAVMRRYWQAFDGLHARQQPGMPSLWGLVEDGTSSIPNPAFPHSPWGYLRLLPRDLLAEIDDCWGGVCIPKYGDRIVSATHPHKGLADAFGAALEFWHGVGLTTWFVCQGPYSRTDLPGVRDYYRGCIASLAEAECPIHESLFGELSAAEQRLGPPEDITEHLQTISTPGSPITLTTSMSRGSRRRGFEILQEIVTRHRRWWAQSYLETHLRNQWQTPILAFANEYNRDIARTGRPPTKRRLATLAAPTADLWFGGDLGATCSAIGVKAPAPQTRVKLMPDDRFEFVSRVFLELGGQAENRDDSWRSPDLAARNWEARRLAGDSLKYIQFEECTGTPPTAAEFHADRYRWIDGEEQGWAGYVAAIKGARQAEAITAAVPPTAFPAPVTPGALRPLSPLSAPAPMAPPTEEGRAPKPGFWERIRGRVR